LKTDVPLAPSSSSPDWRWTAGQKQDPYNYPIRVPRLERAPAIDGDLSE